MPLISIESPRDPRIAPYVDLRDKELRTRQGRFIAEGELVVRRLLESRFTVESLLVADSQLHRIDTPATIPVYCAPKKMIEEIAGFRFHRGILGCGLRPTAGDWVAQCHGLGEPARIVVCSSVQDPANLGGILRNCAAFGVDLVLIGNHTGDPYSRRVLRVSMAAALKLNINISLDLVDAVTRLQDEFGYHGVATVLNADARPLASAPRPSRLALILGNEYAGVDEAIQRKCRTRVTIPMSPGTDSLNVAVASGVFLYHFTQAAPGEGLV